VRILFFWFFLFLLLLATTICLYLCNPGICVICDLSRAIAYTAWCSALFATNTTPRLSMEMSPMPAWKPAANTMR
jgi:hypothetical protein